MNTPYGLEITDSCLACRFRKHGFFCSLPPDLLKPVNAASHQTTLPSGAVLYLEGQTPRGVFMLCAGRVKLSTTSREGRILILRIAEAGEILGLSAVVSGRPHEITAETTASSLVNFIKREAMLKLMEESGELGLRSAQALSGAGSSRSELPAESKDPGAAYIGSERVKAFSRYCQLTGENSLGQQE